MTTVSRRKGSHCHASIQAAKATLYGDIRFHSDQNRCPYCGSVWEGLGSLVFHVRSHTRNKPYTCPIPGCNYAACQKGNLKIHLESETHAHEMSPQILSLIMSLDRINCWSTGNNKERISEAHSDLNVMEEGPMSAMSAITSTPFQFTQRARKRRRLPRLELDSSTSSRQPSPYSVNRRGLKVENSDSQFVASQDRLQNQLILNQNANIREQSDRIKKLEEENRRLRTRVTASQMTEMRISALEKMCYQENIQRVTLTETVKKMNKEKDAADAKNDILVQRLKSEIAIRLQAQQETASLRDRYSSKKPTTEYITIEDN